MKRRSFFVFLLVAFGLVCADQWTKHVVATELALGEERILVPFLSLYHARNLGVAFSLFSSTNNVLLTALTMVIIAFVFYLWLRQQHQGLATQVGYTFVVGGAIGNLIDRLRLHYVVDFIYFHLGDFFKFAIFNLADSFITIGALLIVASEVFSMKKKSS